MTRTATNANQIRLNKTRTQARLLELGMSKYELGRSEAQHLHTILHEGEIIGGVVSGRSEVGHIMIVATDSRILIIDYKPLFNSVEDISYDAVAGVSASHAGPFCTVTLMTRLGDFAIKTMNRTSIRVFKRYIESRSIEHERGGNYA